MKTIFAVAALATVIASSAFAQTPVRRAPAQAAPVAVEGWRAHGIATNPAYDVYEGNQYIGSDPDPNVRLMLRRDFESHD